ncbi:hypothetical protein HPB52_019142 [Rhipicephalus sanguineus]|uniref:Serpin domain-containing protein n=2 Tax=Rhipicephalus sanguineus TaxID=34632 RepID=A0A9D4T1A1_RHISA|nr:hypothetical protein HPB52_019142 [Rhipicephalus sanguineus]
MAHAPATEGAPEVKPMETPSVDSLSASAEESDDDGRRSPSIGNQELELGPTGPLFEPRALEHLVIAINSFTHQLLRYLPRQQNLAFSPSRIYWLLVSVWFGSKDTTRDFFKNLIRSLKAHGRQQRVQFISALYATSVDSLQDATSKTLRECFYMRQTRPYEERDQPLVRDDVPRTCAQRDEREPADHWRRRKVFEGVPLDRERSTILANFCNNGTDPCKARMVRSTSHYRYCASKALSARCLVVPGVGGKWNMLLLLPTDRRGVHAVEYRLDAEALQQAVSSCEETLVELSMPNIELESSVSLREVLKRAGLADLFVPEKVDLSNLFKEGGEQLTEFVHKAKLEVSKVGHEGEYHGVTVFTENCEYPSAPIEFHVNHPFVFVLYEPVSNTTLFIGRVVDLIW